MVESGPSQDCSYNATRPALKDLEVYFESTNGRLSELSKFRDTLGTALVDFSDTGDPEEAGVSTIVARYQHPVFGTLIDSVQITILIQPIQAHQHMWKYHLPILAKLW